MGDFGKFGFGGKESTQKLSKLLVNQKQALTDVSAITQVWKDPELVKTVAVETPFVTELRRIQTPESVYRYEVESSDNFGKFTTEATAASAFSAQKGTYGESTVTTKLMTYLLNIGILGQKAASGYLDLVRQEQLLAMEAMNKGIERCVITGHPAGAASDGSATDSNAFSGIRDLVTTNVYNPTTAEPLSLDTIDTYIDKCVDHGAREQDLLIITDTYSATKFASLFYNLQNKPLEQKEINAGFKINSYRNAPIFASSYTYSKTSGSREMYIIDKKSTVLAEFYKMSQLDLGRTSLSDDSIMFWMGALAVRNEINNAIIKKIV